MIAGHDRFMACGIRAMERDGAKPVMAGIDGVALRGNVERIRQRLGSRGLCAVLKGDAYGHGIDIVAPQILHACSHVAAVDNHELTAVRLLEPEMPLIRLRVGSEFEITQAARAKLNIREMAASLPKIEEIDQIAGHLGQRAEIHLSLDAAGFGRNGLNLADQKMLRSLWKAVLGLKHVRIASIGCHLPDAARADPGCGEDPSRRALDRFVAAARDLFRMCSEAGARLPEISAFSSASSVAFGGCVFPAELSTRAFDRIGSSLFGLTAHSRHQEPGTRQVMHVATVVCDVVHRQEGEEIGYEHCYRVEQEGGEKVALLGAGWLALSRYQQGLGKVSSPACCMSAAGRTHWFLGRQSMNISTVAARESGGTELAPGDLVFLTTDHGPRDACPTIARVAAWMGGVQPEYVTSTFGGSASTMRFPF